MRRLLPIALMLALLAPVRGAAAEGDSREARALALVSDATARLATGEFGQRRIAIRLLEEAAQLEPKSASTLQALAHAYLDAGFNHLARVSFEKAARADARNPEGWFGLALLYKRNWLRSLAPEDFDRAVANAEAALRVEPRHCGAAVLLSVLRAESGAFADAGRAVTDAYSAGCASPELALASVYLAFRSGDAARAESLLVAVRPRLAPEIAARFDDVAPMLGADDAEALAALGPGEGAAYARRFWAGSDPDPTTPLNEALAEYHARVAHALLVFTDTWNPRWDMRAALYVRFGAPGKVTFLPVGVTDHYRLNRAEVYWTSPDGLSRREITQPMFLPMNVQVWEYPQLGMTVQIRDVVLSQTYEMPRSDTEVVEARVDSATAERSGLVAAASGRAVFSPLLPGVRRLEVAGRVSRFTGASGPRLLAQFEMPGSPADSLVAECVVLDSLGGHVADATVRPSPSRCDPAALRTAEFAFDVPSGRYQVAFSVGGSRRGRGVARMALAVDSAAAGLTMSDVVPVCGSYDGGGSGAVRLAPNVGARVAAGAPLYVYFEVYGLRTDEDGRSRFDLVTQVHAPGRESRPWYSRVLGGRPHARIEVRSEESNPGPLRRQFLQVPVGSLGPGAYRLDVTVHDLLGGGSTVRSLAFVR